MIFGKKEKPPETLPDPVSDIVRNIDDKSINSKEIKIEEVKPREIEVKEPETKINEPQKIEIEHKEGPKPLERDKRLFFSHLLKELQEGILPIELMGQDFKELMKNYHKQGIVGYESLLSMDTMLLIKELEQLEQEWKIKNKELMRIEQELFEIESMIDEKLSKLKQYMDKLRRIQRLKKEVSSDKYFYARNGEIYRNVFELREALRNMDEELFNYHRDHFIKWISDVFNDKELASMLKGKTKKEFIEILSSL